MCSSDLAWYLRLVFGTTPRAHLITIAALAALTGATLPAPALATAVAVVIALSALVAVEHLKPSDQSHENGSTKPA